MKSNHSLNFILFFTLLSITACTQEDSEQILQENEIKLKSQISTSSSRGTNLNQQSTQIVEGQQVGVTIKGAQTVHNNVAWTVGEEGILTASQPIYWNNTEVTITAYQPYNPNWTTSLHAFSVQTDQSTDYGYLNSDLLWTSTTATPTEEPVSLTFAHKLAKINVILSSEDFPNLNNAVVSICGTYTTTDFLPDVGALGMPRTKADIIAAVTTVDTHTATAIIVPQEIESGTKFIQVAHNGLTYIFYIPSTKKFESGHSYTYRLKLKGNSLDIDSDSITDWEDEVVTPEGGNDSKKLTGVSCIRKYSKAIGTFTYDEKGRVISLKGTEEDLEEGIKIDYTYTYTWEGNKCTQTCDVNEDQTVVFTFENNMMKTSTWGPWTQTFTYNDAKQLARVDHTFTDSEKTYYETFTWENGKLIEGGDGVTLSYSNQTFNGFNPAIYLYENDILEDVPLALPHPELVGLKINHLVNSISAIGYDYVYNFTYTFDDDGYISGCNVVETDGNTEIFSFVWE